MLPYVVRRSPQEKKALSYARDRRNDFGSNEKAARRSIPRRKRAARHAERTREHLALRQIRGTVGTAMAQADRADARLAARRPGPWRKWPGAPLGEVVERKLIRRARLGIIDHSVAARRIARIRVVPP